MFSKIEKVHLELTDKCNAKCPMCSRTNPDGLKPRPFVGKNELYLDDIKKIFTSDFFSTKKAIKLCGNYGDPCVARDVLPICEYFITHNCDVVIWTNGGMRQNDWWKKLGSVFSKSQNSSIVFTIDGLEDTNHMYRVNTNFNKIIDNAQAFIKAGGVADWCFIIFKHNQHQINAAKALADKLGFRDFTCKETSRFQAKSLAEKLGLGKLFSKETLGFKNRKFSYKTKSGEIVTLEEPDREILSQIKETRKESDDKHKRALFIDCIAAQRQEIFISASGNVYACCWLGAKGHKGKLKIYNYDLNTKNKELKEILNDEYFTDILPASFSSRPHKVCKKICGRQLKTKRVTVSDGEARG